MTSVHLLLLIHGLWGNPTHLGELARIAKETHSEATADGTRLRILVAESNSSSATYDGIDWGGERVAQEVYDEKAKIEAEGQTITKFSVTGYSLGGLIARYVIGILKQREFFESVKPMNFNTIATPHLGLPIWNGTFFSSVSNFFGPTLLSRTGEQFYGVDNYASTGKPLLEIMADSSRVFYQSLAAFQNKRIYANAVYDSTVPYVTAAMEEEDPFAEHLTNGIQIKMNEKYPALVESWSLPENPPVQVVPRFGTPSWFRHRKETKKESRPSLPPFLQFRFPFNILFYTLLPILIPIGLTLAYTRLRLDARSSRSRLRELEKELSKDTPNGRKLIKILSEMEAQMEIVIGDAVGNIVDNANSSLSKPAAALEGLTVSSSLNSPSQPSSSSSSTSNVSSQQTTNKEEKEIAKLTPRESKRSRERGSASKPALTPLQKKLAMMLNTMPELKKERAMFKNVVNSHGMIISRDVKRFEAHKQGWAVVRHWADQLVV
jgi:hypothetical protein